jgi:hypothetical protein
MKLPLCGYGLWNISRGIAREKSAYIAALVQADAPRQGPLDGRGNLSEKGLTGFCEFFLGLCLDQIDYMGRMLALDGLLERVQGYVNLRKEKAIAAPTAASPPLRKEAARMLQETLLRGEVSRGDAIRCAGMAERTGRKLLGQLQQEGLLVSDTPKGPVEIRAPRCSGRILFPGSLPGSRTVTRGHSLRRRPFCGREANRPLNRFTINAAFLIPRPGRVRVRGKFPFCRSRMVSPPVVCTPSTP